MRIVDRIRGLVGQSAGTIQEPRDISRGGSVQRVQESGSAQNAPKETFDPSPHLQGIIEAVQLRQKMEGVQGADSSHGPDKTVFSRLGNELAGRSVHESIASRALAGAAGEPNFNQAA